MKKLLSVLSVFAFATIAAGTASAGQIATPTGLNAGDQFRFVFVTTTKTTATSGDLSTYDNIVSAEATGYTYGGNSPTWKAIVTNATTNASDHIGVSLTSTIPLYTVVGTKVSSGTLWGDEIELNSGIDTNINGTYSDIDFVWTGTRFTDGGSYLLDDAELMSRISYVGDSTYAQIMAGLAYTGDPTNSIWVSYQVKSMTESHYLYGISDVLTVPSAVPEPSTVMLVGLGGLAALGYSFKRKRA